MSYYLCAVCVLVSVSTLVSAAPSNSGADRAIRTGVRAGGPGSCIALNCSRTALACFTNSQCREAFSCLEDCQKKGAGNSCDFYCEVNYAYNSTVYANLMQCMSDHGCFPKEPEDGTCLAKDSDAVKNLTDVAQIKGKWWTLRGLNCGQRGWPGALDTAPCQSDEISMVDGHWADRFSFCGGSNGTCDTKYDSHC